MDFVIQRGLDGGRVAFDGQQGGYARRQLEHGFAHGGKGAGHDRAHGLHVDDFAFFLRKFEFGQARFGGFAQGFGDVVAGDGLGLGGSGRGSRRRCLRGSRGGRGDGLDGFGARVQVGGQGSARGGYVDATVFVNLQDAAFDELVDALAADAQLTRQLGLSGSFGR